MPATVNRTGATPVYNLLARLGRALWPPCCLLCESAGTGGLDLCEMCLAALPCNRRACMRCAMPIAGVDGLNAQSVDLVCGRCLRRPPPQAHARAAFVYGFPLDRLLPRAKFHGDLSSTRLLAALMTSALSEAERPQALVPIPLHASRLRERGYDQALELARPLARRLGLPLRDDLLRRTRATAAQSRLDAIQRRRNLRGAFAVRGGCELPGHVALVDDVMTTGATVHAAASALLRAGVTRVDVWVCARVP